MRRRRRRSRKTSRPAARRRKLKLRLPKFKVNPKAVVLAVVLSGLALFLLKDFVLEKDARAPHDLSKYPVPSLRVAAVTSVPVLEIAPKREAAVTAPKPVAAKAPAPRPVLKPVIEEPVIVKPKPVEKKEPEKKKTVKIEVKKKEPVKKAPAPVFKPSKALEAIKKWVAPKKPVKKAEKPKEAEAPKPKTAAPKAEPKKGILPRPAPPPEPVAKPAVARMAIILDDWGNNYYVMKYLLEIDRPITIAILPNLRHSQRIAEEAHQKRLGVMLHMPMEPESASQPLEPQTIRTSTSDWEIRRYLDEALAGVPHVEGVNNHMGSKATSDPRVMRLVLKRLKEKGLFFIDSNTSSKTVAPRVAKELGIRFTQRDVFLDNELNSAAIRRQLIEAKEYALEHGEVVVIGHDKKITLEAIRDMVSQLEKEGVRFVLAKDLVRRQ
ncbi:MAG: divergent polysaccharide deacetylase family protein [Candidatus Omnitrophota bacterium]